jgi:hypothetical protein
MPAFVPLCQYDVFISYAQVAEKEWVRVFREKLQEHLDRELHQDKAASIFWDRNELADDDPLTAEITQALSNTATLLIVLSKAYLDRPWCLREREVTAQVVKTRITLQLATLDRLRAAETEPLRPVGRLHTRR